MMLLKNSVNNQELLKELTVLVIRSVVKTLIARMDAVFRDFVEFII